MNNIGGNIFVNRIFEIDTSRSNVNRIMNPSVRNYSVNEPVKNRTADNNHTGDNKSFQSPNQAASAASGTAEAKKATGSPGRYTTAAESQRPDGENMDNTRFKLEFTGDNMMNALILSELLGKPKFLQKRRW